MTNSAKNPNLVVTEVNPSAKTISECLGVTNERFDELQKKAREVIAKDKTFSSTLADVSVEASTPAELILLGFIVDHEANNPFADMMAAMAGDDEDDK